MKMPSLISGLIIFGVILFGGRLAAQSPLPEPPARTENAIRAESDRLVAEGRRKEAFLALLTFPGAECEAAALALGAEEATWFLSVLQSQVPPLQGARRHLVEAELYWKIGNQEKSLAHHRSAIAGVAKEYSTDWSGETLPRDFYPTVPEREAGPGSSSSRGSDECFRRPFGTERRFPPDTLESLQKPVQENLWLNRFTTAKAWPEARAEYERIWNIHRDRLRPHVYREEARRGEPPQPLYVRQPHGWSKGGLAFASAYADFLRKQGQEERADEILLEVLLAMDMDRILPEDALVKSAGAPLKLPVHCYVVSTQRWALSPLMGGLGRRAFIHDAVSQLQQGTNRMAKLEGRLRAAIDAGHPEMLRVLAAVAFEQEHLERAIELEEQYLAQRRLDALSLTLRRAAYHDSFDIAAEAMKFYGQALNLPGDASRFNVPILVPGNRAMAPKGGASIPKSEVDIPELDNDPPEPSAIPGTDPIPGWRRWVKARMLALAQATNNPSVQAQVHLASLERPDGSLAPAATVFDVQKTLESLSLKDEMTKWASERLQKFAPGQEPATLLFLLGRNDQALVRLEEDWKGAGPAHRAFWPDRETDEWRRRFEDLGKQRHRQFLGAFVKSFPASPYGKAWLLSLHEGEDAPALVPWMEELLLPREAKSERVFRRIRSPELPDICANPYQLAHRLMRLYRRSGKQAELVSLGQRVKSGKQPFVIDKSWRDHGEWELWQRNCVALLQEVEEPKAALPLADAKARRVFPWILQDDTVELFASLDSVLAVAAATEGAHFFTGHPWGVAVFGTDGKPQVRIPLGHAATHLAVSPGFVWAGTPNGLYRITAGTWSVHHLSLAESLSDPESPPDVLDAFHAHKHAVRCLLRDGRSLWMGGGRVIQKLDLDSLEVTAFRRLPGVSEDKRVDAEQLYAERDFVWLGSWWGISRYDKRSGAWQNLPPPPGGKWGETLTRAGNNLWALAEMPGRGRGHVLHRIEGADLLAREVKMNGGSLQDKVFRPVREQGGMMLFAGTYSLWGWAPSSDQLTNLDRRMLSHTEWAGLAEPGKTSSAQDSGGMTIRARRYDRRDPASTQASDLLEQEAQEPSGLIEFGGGASEIKKPWNAAEWEGVTRGSVVWDAVEDDQGNVWLCTNRGLTVVSATGGGGASSRRNCLRHWGMDEGLVGERVCSGAWAGRKLWFATMWGDDAGALMFYDPAKGQFGSRTKEDGLASNMISRLEVKDGQLMVHHGMEYDRRHEGESYLFTPSLLDAQSMKILRTGERSTASPEEKTRWVTDRVGNEWCPVLGGRLLAQRRTSSGVWYCGAHGAVFVPGQGIPEVTEYPRLPVKIVAGD
ncbi:hypothetical protein [Verrucomicrobium sp. BvORR106]|uniref:hypothetical protein n=1 Tax=Verrucomicrobium sp. BvORR106 TaxID=1403819 RepID=UPI000571DEE4|nr:hypothetical protein [Verrucomicrobium sp. BvORR106]